MSLLKNAASKAASEIAKRANAETVGAGIETAFGFVESALELVESAPERLQSLTQSLEDRSFANINEQLDKAFGKRPGNVKDSEDSNMSHNATNRLIIRA